MLTVLTWWWNQAGGRATYTREHLLIWADMVRRHLTLPHRLAVVTDLVDELPGIDVIAPPRDFENVRIPTWGEDRGLPQCLRRIAMFEPDAASIFGERFVSMDMDCVVAGSLDPLFDRPDDFVMYRGGHANRPYNGSMVMMTAGARSQVYTTFTPEGAAEAGQKYIGSDQAWISHVLGWGEATWGVEDGVIWWGSQYNGQAPEKRIMFFPGNPKPWDVVDLGIDDWVRQNYRRNVSGRALILGYGPSIWSDVERAMVSGPFDAVIASPEAAEHWPAPVLAIANDDAHALRLARMHGFEDFVFCGRSGVANVAA